jgi:hypothetical protein
MVEGRFETFTGAPTLDCYVDIKILKVSGVVPFLIDTGADCTVLMPADATRLKIDFDELERHGSKRKSFGVGGEVEDYLVPAALVVSDNGMAHAYKIALRVAKPIPETDELPSLLGRDILRYWRLTCDMPNKRLSIDIIMSDEEFSLTPTPQEPQVR